MGGEFFLVNTDDDVSVPGLAVLFCKQCYHWLAMTSSLVPSLVTYRATMCLQSLSGWRGECGCNRVTAATRLYEAEIVAKISDSGCQPRLKLYRIIYSITKPTIL